MNIINYGIITRNDKYFFYILVPFYPVDKIYNLNLTEKQVYIKNIIRMVKYFSNNNKYIYDMFISNISINEQLEPIIIDYNTNTILSTITELLQANATIPPNIYYNDPLNKYKVDKIYQFYLANLVYNLYMIGNSSKSQNSINYSFNEFVYEFINGVRLINFNEDKYPKYYELLDKSNFIGQDKILFDMETKKGLLANNYNDILSLDEIEQLLPLIKEKIDKILFKSLILFII